MDSRTRREGPSSYVMIGVSIVAGIFSVVAALVVLKEAFSLMSRKSDTDFILGLTLVAVLIACFVICSIKVYRVFTQYSQQNARKMITEGDSHEHRE